MRVIFADILKKLRAEKGLSQRELAERLFVTRSTVARWENGSRLPDASMISRLSFQAIPLSQRRFQYLAEHSSGKRQRSQCHHG